MLSKMPSTNHPASVKEGLSGRGGALPDGKIRQKIQRISLPSLLAENNRYKVVFVPCADGITGGREEKSMWLRLVAIPRGKAGRVRVVCACWIDGRASCQLCATTSARSRGGGGA